MTRRELPVGAAGEASMDVQESDLACALSPAHLDSFPRVFATARMVALMEMAAARAMKPIVEEGEVSAGVLVNVTHTAATPVGAKVTATARFLGMAGKFYEFEVAASDGAGEVGRGMHRRAIVQHGRLLDGADRRRR